MPHLTSSQVTAGPTPQSHVGLNYVVATHTVSETLSGSLTISMAALPAGARVTNAVLSWDNGGVTAGDVSGQVEVQIRTGGTKHTAVIKSGSLNAAAQVLTYNPLPTANGYRVTASSHAVLLFTNLPGSGTATTIFTLALSYDCQKSGD